jgi:hypothetical protein
MCDLPTQVTQSLDPGNLETDLRRHMPGWQAWIFVLQWHSLLIPKKHSDT